jgi:uncharacterized integral membrane protein (TIGR00698 family)
LSRTPNAGDSGDDGDASPTGDASPSRASQHPRRIVIPWFALGFVAVAGLNSLAVLPHAFVSIAVDFDTGLLAMAMAALGVTTHVSAVRTAGIKPLALAALLFIWLILGGVVINVGISALFG